MMKALINEIACNHKWAHKQALKWAHNLACKWACKLADKGAHKWTCKWAHNWAHLLSLKGKFH